MCIKMSAVVTNNHDLQQWNGSWYSVLVRMFGHVFVIKFEISPARNKFNLDWRI
jgi:hypothetical protein